MINYDELIQLISSRRSCRNYFEQDVPDELIEKCLEAARLAPSACNKQPWRFVVVKDAQLRGSICREGILPGLPMPWLNEVPVIIAICAKMEIITHKLAKFISKVDYSPIDIGIAGEHFVLAAESLGLGSCWIGWFKEKAIKRILNIPRNIKVVSLLSLGYPADVTAAKKEKLLLADIYLKNIWYF